LAKIDPDRVAPELREAAEGMEALFLDYLTQTMRKTVPKSEMNLEGPGTALYQSMLDSKVAENSAHAGGIGLAAQIIESMESARYTGSQAVQAVPPRKVPSTGGTE